jgi:hypothetical protein
MANNFSASKDTIKKEPTEWEKMFTSNTSDKGLLSRIHKVLSDLILKDNPSKYRIRVWIEDRSYLKEYLHLAVSRVCST